MRYAVILLIAAALSGCADTDVGPRDSIEISEGEVPPDRDVQKTISCGAATRLTVQSTAGDEGDFTVTVYSGNGIPVEQSAYSGATATEHEEDLAGNGGLWKLRVDRSLTYDGTFVVKLTCL